MRTSDIHYVFYVLVFNITYNIVALFGLGFTSTISGHKININLGYNLFAHGYLSYRFIN